MKHKKIIIALLLTFVFMGVLTACGQDKDLEKVFIEIHDPITGKFVSGNTNSEVNWEWDYNKLPSYQNATLRFKAAGKIIDVPKYNGSSFDNMLAYEGKTTFPTAIGEHILTFTVDTGSDDYKNKDYIGTTLTVKITIFGRPELNGRSNLNYVDCIPSESTNSLRKSYKFVAPYSGQFTIKTDADVTNFLEIDGVQITSSQDNKKKTAQITLNEGQEIIIVTGPLEYDSINGYFLEIEFTP